VLAGLIKVSPILAQLYARSWTVKPSGDTDVIEKQKMIETMQQAWPVVQNTGAASLFLTDLLEKMFPDNSAKYVKAIQDQQQQQQGQQAQQQQAFMSKVKQLADQVVSLSKHREMFSETGLVNALPAVQAAAQQIEQMQQQAKGQQ
jgi:hypothetical protein